MLTPAGLTLPSCIEEGLGFSDNTMGNTKYLPTEPEILSAWAFRSRRWKWVGRYRNQWKKLFYFRWDVTTTRDRVLSLRVIERR